MDSSLNKYDPALGSMTPRVAELIVKNIRERAQHEMPDAYEAIKHFSDREVFVLAKWVSQGCPGKMEVEKDVDVDVDAFLSHYASLSRRARKEYINE